MRVARNFVSNLYEEFLGRPAESVGLEYWTQEIELGRTSYAEVTELFFQSPEFQSLIEPIVYMYTSALGRPPESEGMLYWSNLYRIGGATLEKIGNGFIGSAEFQAQLPDQTNAGFVTTLYQNTLHRAPDATGLNYWVNQMNRGMSRAEVLLGFAQSEENIELNGPTVQTSMVYWGLLGRAPTEAEFAEGSDKPVIETIDAILGTPLNPGEFDWASLYAGQILTLKEVIIGETTTDDIITDIQPTVSTHMYWGYNPHAHGEDNVDNLNDPNGNNLTNEGPQDGGVPIEVLFGGEYDGVTYPGIIWTYLENQQEVLDLLDTMGNLAQIRDITIAGAADENQGTAGVGGAGGTAGAGGSGDGAIGGDANGGDGSSSSVPGDYTGTYTITVTLDDGSTSSAQVSLSQQQFDFINGLLFDAEGNSRLFEKEFLTWPQVELKDQHGNVIEDADGNPILVDLKQYVAEGITSKLYAPLVLTPISNNDATIEPAYTTDADDTIVAGRLDLLHQAYIDGGEGYDVLEVDAKGHFAQPLALINIEHVKIQNLPNIYSYGPNGTEMDPFAYARTTGDFSNIANALQLNQNSILDLSRATQLETITVTEGMYQGLVGLENGIPLGSLTLTGIRNGAETILDGSFTQNVYLNFSELQGAGVKLVFNNLSMGDYSAQGNYNSNPQLVVAHNAEELTIETSGGNSYLYNGDLGGRLNLLTITGDQHLFIEGDLDASFQDTTPVTIDASANTGGVNLTLSGSENVTFLGSQADDIFIVDTSEDDDSLLDYMDDDSVTIVDNGGNNRFEIETEILNVTLLDGNNKVSVYDAESITLTAGDGNNHFQIASGAEVSIVVGDGNNRMEIEADGMGDEGTVDDSLDYQSNVSITAGNGQNNIDVEVNEDIGVATIVAGDGGNEINVSAHEVNITTGSSADVIKVLSDIIVINSGGGGDTITIGGWDYDYVGTDELGGNAPSNETPEWGEDGALVQVNTGSGPATIHLGSGENYPWEEDDNFPGVTSITAMEGSFITGESITLFVDTVADLRAATLTGITRVVLDDDSFDLDDAPTANNAEGGINAAVLTLTTSQFAAIGAENFSVQGAVFNTHGFIKLIVDETTSLTDLGVDQLPRNIDLLLEVQDGVTLTMTAQQMHTRVAQNGVSLANDGNTDYGNGKVVITGGGLNFDPFNTSDTVRTVIGGTQYLGGSLSDDFKIDGNWYNVTVRSVYNGYDRPADAEVVVVLTIDSTVTQDVGAFSTWHDNLEIVGDQDINFTGTINLAQGTNGASNLDDGPFNIDFSALEGVVNNLTVDGFEHLAQGGGIWGNGNNGYASEVLIQIAKDVADDGVGFDEDEAGSLVSQGVSQYTVTVIEGPTANGSTGNTATIKLCDTAQDIEVFALRGNWNDTLKLEDAAWGLVFELQGGGTAKAEGPTGTANVGILDANFEWEGADAVVNMTHSVAGDTRAIYAAGIEIDNAKSITVNSADGNAIIDHIEGNEVANLIFASEGFSFSIHDDISIAHLSGIDASAVAVDFTATLTGTADGAGFDFVASAGTTTLTLDEVSAGTHSSFVAEDAATFNLVVYNAVDLAKSTLTNVDAISLGEIGDIHTNSVTLTTAQALEIGLANITLTHPGLLGSLNLVNLGSEAFDAGDLGAGVTLGTVSIAEGDITLDPSTDLTDASVTVAADSTLTLTADQFMALTDLDGTDLDTTVINITGLTQAHIDAGFTLAGVSNATGSVSLAEDVILDVDTDLNGFSVTLADGQTIALATETQADGLEVNGGDNTTIKILFTDGWHIDASGYDVSTLLFPADLVAGQNVDAVFENLPQDVVKTLYNDLVQLVDQTVTLQAGVTVNGGLDFNHRDHTVELQDFTLNLAGGNVIKGDINLSVSTKGDNGEIQTYLDSVTINSDGTAGNLATGKTDNIITGTLTTQEETATSSFRGDNELLNVTINATQKLQLQGGIIFEAEINDDEVATLTVNGTADVTIGSLNTQSDEVDGLNVINNGTGVLTVGIVAADIDVDDALSFTGSGNIALSISGAVDLSDDDLAAVSQIILTNGSALTLTMEQADDIGAANFVLVDGATATLNLSGLDGEPFAVANYPEGVTVAILTVAADPIVTLHATTDLTGITGLVVPEGTVLNLTAAQFQQLTGNGTITGIDADGNVSTDFTVHITDLMQADADVVGGIDLSGVTADVATITLAEDVELVAADDLGSFDVVIGDGLTLTLADLEQADALNFIGGVGSTLKFTDTFFGAFDQIDASGFDVDTLMLLNILVDSRNIDLMFTGLPERVTKVIYNGEGWANTVDQTAEVVAGTTVDGFVVFNNAQPDTEIANFTLNLQGGTEINGNLRLSTTDKFDDVNENGVQDSGEADLMRSLLQTVTINSTGTASNLLNGETANVINGMITAGGSGFQGSYTSTDNNLLDVTINATQELVVEGVEFSSVVDDDDFVANDDDAAVATLTVNGTADVNVGVLDTSDDEVDGLNVINNGSGILSATLNAANIDADDALSFTGTGAIELTTVGVIDLSDDDLAAVSSTEVVETGSLTLSHAQYTALGVANLTVIDGPDGGTVIGNASLFINGYAGGAFNATALDTHFNVVEITTADQDVTLDAGVDLTNVTKLWVQEGRTLTLTAAQFQQLKDNGAIDGVDTDGDSTVEAFNVVITDLTQADVDRNLDNDAFADADDGFSVESVNTHGGNITITLGESEVTLGKMVDGVLVAGSASVLTDASTVPVMADFELTDGQTLGLVSYGQANGLDVDGSGNTTIIYKFADLQTYNGPSGWMQIDASGYNVTTLKALAASFTDNGVTQQDNNIEFSIDDLPSTVELRLYADPNELGFLDPTFRRVVIEEGVTTPTNLVFNDYDPTDELRTLDLTLSGDSTLNGDLMIPTRSDKDGGLVTRFFDTLTIRSEGTLPNTIVGNITTQPQYSTPNTTYQNNLLNVVITAAEDLVIGNYSSTGVHVSGGDIVFNNNHATDDAAANLSVSGSANVIMHGLDVDEAVGGGIDTLNVTNNSTGTLTLTGGTAAIAGNGLENLFLIGSGDIVMGSDSNGVGAEGIASTTLSLIDATDLTGDLTLAEITIDNVDFTLLSGTGKTTLTVMGETLNADANGADDVDGNDDDEPGWTFDLSAAGVDSELHLGANTYTQGDLSILLGTNTTLYIDANTDWTTLDSLTISQVKDIVLADGVTLTLTAQQAAGLNIIAGPDTGAVGITATVNVTMLGDEPVDLSGIAANIAGTATLEDDDVTLDATTDLGDFSITLVELDDTSATLAGQTIRFTTVAQADGREIIVDEVIGNNNDSSTNVVWLFDNITAPVETQDYDAAIGRLWMSEDLINNEGGLVESLFTTLPSTILRVDFTSLTALNALLSSNQVNRVMELVNFAQLGNMTFSDTGASPEEHIENLTLKMGGQVTVGNILIDDVVAAPNTDPNSVQFNTLTLDSHRALHEDNILAAEAYLNDNDGIVEMRDGIDADLDNDDPENAQPANLNTVGNIGVGNTNTDIDLLDVVVNTYGVSVVGDGSLGDGANLQIATVSFDSSVANETASFDVNGDNDVTVKALNVTDADITTLNVDTAGHNGTFTITGGSPAIRADNTETVNIATGTALGLNISPSIFDDGFESITINYTLNGVVGAVVINDPLIDFTNAGAIETAVANALDALEGISAAVVAGEVKVTEQDGNSFVYTSADIVDIPGDGMAVTIASGDEEGAGIVRAGTAQDTVNNVPYAGVDGGEELSEINVTGDGYVDLGTIARIDSTDDDLNNDGDLLDAGENVAFTLNGNGNTVATLGRATILNAGGTNTVVAPQLNAEQTWEFNDVALTITEDVVFQAGATPAEDPILVLNNVDLTMEGDVNLTRVILAITGGMIYVPTGQSLTLTVAQARALSVDVVGSGTVKIVGDATLLGAAADTVGAHLKTINVDLSAVTLDLVGTAGIDADLDSMLDIELPGAVDDNGDAAGQSVVGSVNDDDITTADDLNDTLNGGAGNDTLNGGVDTLADGDDFNTYVVASGTDTIIGLKTGDVIKASAAATAQANVADGFTATAATTNTGATVSLTAVNTVANTDNVIDMTLAGGTSGYSITGSSYRTDPLDPLTSADGNDTLIGSILADTINGGNSVQESADQVDTLTGLAGNDIFVFEIAESTPVDLTRATTTPGVDKEQWDFDPQGFGNATGFVADNDGGQALTVLYRNNGTSTSFTINDDVSINFADGDALAQRIATELSSRGVAASYNTATDLLTLTGTAGQSVEINSLTPVGGAWADTTPGDDTPIQVVGYDGANDVAQISTVTVGDGTLGPVATMGERFSVSVALAEGSTLSYEYTALGGETEVQIATALAGGLTGLAGVQYSAANGGTNVITITDSIADNGGFSLTTDNNPGIAGTGASALGAGAGVWANAFADVITDFNSVADSIQLGIANGTAANYDEAATVASYNAAWTAADAAFNADTALRYYLTSIDGSTPGESATGLLFFEANGDKAVDGVILLTGITDLNFSESDILL